MRRPAAIDKNFVPHNKRAVLRRHAGLFVDGSSTTLGAPLAVSDETRNECYGKDDGTPCRWFKGKFHGKCLSWSCV